MVADYPGPGRDRIVEMLLQHTTVDLAYEDCIGVTNVRVHEDRDAALTEIVDRYHAVARQCDVVVILGTDYTGVPSPTEFDFNATVAVNLGAPVLLVIRGADRTPEEIGTNLVSIVRGDDILRATWTTYEGHPYLSLRIWTPARDGPGYWPTRRGVSIRRHELADIRDALEAAIQLAERFEGDAA